MANKLKLGLPKGSLETATIDLFRRAGFAILLTAHSAARGGRVERVAPGAAPP